jgi:hypothetical protein
LMWSFLRHNILIYYRNDVGFIESTRRQRRLKREADQSLPSSLEVKNFPGDYTKCTVQWSPQIISVARWWSMR